MNAQSAKAIVTLVVTVGFNIANAVGFALDYGMTYNVVFSIVALLSVAYAWWKNQNVTKTAQLAQEYLDDLKAKEEE